MAYKIITKCKACKRIFDYKRNINITSKHLKKQRCPRCARVYRQAYHKKYDATPEQRERRREYMRGYLA